MRSLYPTTQRRGVVSVGCARCQFGSKKPIFRGRAGKGKQPPSTKSQGPFPSSLGCTLPSLHSRFSHGLLTNPRFEVWQREEREGGARKQGERKEARHDLSRKVENERQLRPLSLPPSLFLKPLLEKSKWASSYEAIRDFPPNTDCLLSPSCVIIKGH